MKRFRQNWENASKDRWLARSAIIFSKHAPEFQVVSRKLSIYLRKLSRSKDSLQGYQWERIEYEILDLGEALEEADGVMAQLKENCKRLSSFGWSEDLKVSISDQIL